MIDLSTRERRLAGKVALVTGASRGIGQAIARRLAAEGAAVILHHNRGGAEAAALASELTSAGAAAWPLKADLTSLAEIESLFGEVDRTLLAHTGVAQLDILVNNAGLGIKGTVEETSPEDYDTIMATNVRGPFFVTRHALSRMRPGGSIVYISSLVTRVPLPDLAAYCVSKAALNELSVLLSVQLRSKGITVNGIAPGPVAPDLNPGAHRLVPRMAAGGAANHISGLQRKVLPEEVAAVTAFLASDDGKFVTGQCVEVSGGLWL